VPSQDELRGDATRIQEIRKGRWFCKLFGCIDPHSRFILASFLFCAKKPVAESEKIDLAG
jgi:hypothetical protein